MKFKIKKSYYRIFSLALTIVIIALSVPTSAASNTESKVLLSSLSKEECIEFLADNNIVVPEELKSINITKVISAYEADMNFEYVVSYPILSDFLNSVRQAVNEYYGYNDTLSTRNASEYTLLYSTLHLWDEDTMPQYNCYAYALGYTVNCYPGNFSNQSYDGSAGIIDLAFLVKDDLNGDLNKRCVKVQLECPSSTSGWDGAIAARKETTATTGVNDAHFAKLTSSGWYHKPGGSAILKFNDPPSNAVDWTNEGYKGYYFGPSITYDSNVLFLLYKELHSHNPSTYLKDHYHLGSNHYFIYARVCPDCNEEVYTRTQTIPCNGPPCMVPAATYDSFEIS